jgi:hypothetical protein
MNEDQAIQDILRKIDREQNIIKAANAMRQATNNAQVTSRAESQIRDARRNLQYFEQTLQDLRRRKMGDDMNNLSISGNGGPAVPPKGPAGQSRAMYSPQGYGSQGDYGAPGPGGYSEGGAPGLMPPRAPYAPPGPGDRSPRARPNYSKLGMSDVAIIDIYELI